jgi:uncharacterized protein DUF1559
MSRLDVIVTVCGVIVVVVLFLGVSMPSVNPTRERARQAACRNNLKQIGIAIEMFCQDHDGRYMRAGDDAELPDGGFTVGEATGVFDSSLTLALLGTYTKHEEYLFECPNMDHRAALTKDKSTGGSGNIDADGDGEEGDGRFKSTISADCDPDYLIDPRIPTQAAAARIIMADGPDLQHERFWKQPWASDPSQFNAKEVSNHPNRAIVLRVDGSVGYLEIDRSTGKAANEDCEGAIGSDEDIYDDDDMHVAGEYRGDEKVDCNLGNYRFYDPGGDGAVHMSIGPPRGLWHRGPDWDQRL